jgi:pSer/pThr/pTyr-binding forkhead associated (FHA) protein
MPQLFVLSGPDIGRSFTVRHGDTLGRSPECIVTLKHASLSRNHAHVECEGERWFIVDDGSRNGVLVGKQRTARAELRDMDEFQLGELHLRFRSSAPAVEAPSGSKSVAPPAPNFVAPTGFETQPRAAEPVEEELQLEGAGELELEGGTDEPIITMGGGTRAPVIRPTGDSPYQAAGPFALPKDESAPAARRPGPPAPAPRKLSMESAETEVVARSAATASSNPAPSHGDAAAATPALPRLEHSMLDTGFGRGAAPSAGATISRSTRKPGDGILQYGKVESGGVELSQLSAPLRYALYALALAVMLGLAWLAFRGTSMLKGRASSDAASDGVESVDGAPSEADEADQASEADGR